ncbi:PhoH family protein [Catenibacillus scindens]|nr:PhoH family protein [Catenibacillus scindens]
MTQIFGPFDSNIKLIEKTLPVTITGQGDRVKVTGEEGAAQKAAQVLETLKKMRDNHEIVNENVVSQAIDLVDDGAADEAVMVMKDVITLTNKGKPVKCKTIGQRNYINAIKDHAVTICIGPAGTGKTYLAIAMAVDALKREEISRIILTRPAVEAGEHLGFLPGDLQSKVDPYLRPLYDALFEMLGEESFNRNLERGIIEVAPLAYMRGRTLNNSFVILDEAQNASLEQMFMVLTRLGEGSKIIVTGDVTQVDLMDRASGLERSAMILKDVDGIAISRLSNRDVVRHKLVRDIIKAFENYREKEDIKQRRKTDDTEHRRRSSHSRRIGLQKNHS